MVSACLCNSIGTLSSEQLRNIERRINEKNLRAVKHSLCWAECSDFGCYKRISIS